MSGSPCLDSADKAASMVYGKSFPGGSTMAHRDWELEGKAKQVKGKVNEVVGDLTGDMSQKYRGKSQQGVGKVQESVGEVTNDADRARRRDL